jgi:hypothetical protein
MVQLRSNDVHTAEARALRGVDRGAAGRVSQDAVRTGHAPTKACPRCQQASSNTGSDVVSCWCTRLLSPLSPGHQTSGPASLGSGGMSRVCCRPLLAADSMESVRDRGEPVMRTLSMVSLEGSEGSGSAAQPQAQAKRKGRFNIVAEEAGEGGKVAPRQPPRRLLAHLRCFAVQRHPMSPAAPARGLCPALSVSSLTTAPPADIAAGPRGAIRISCCPGRRQALGPGRHRPATCAAGVPSCVASCRALWYHLGWHPFS